MSEQVSQTTTHVSLEHLVHMVETGRLRPAAFSRPQVWSARQVADLFDSIIRGYPIGTFLVVQQPADEEDVLLGNMLIRMPSDKYARILIDGVQRVAAIVGTLSDLRGNATDDRFQPCYNIKRDAVVPGPPQGNYMLPLYISRSNQRLRSWISEHPFLTESETDSCFRVHDAIKIYQVTVVELSGSDASATAREIFTRINTTGVSLTRPDLARARAQDIGAAKGRLNKLQNEAERSGFGRITLQLAAQCAWAVVAEEHTRGIGRRPIWSRPAQSFEQLDETVKREAIARAQSAMLPAIQFLRKDAGIFHIRLLPQNAILPTLVRFVSRYGLPTGRAGELLKRWIWRYGATSNSGLRPRSLNFSEATALEEATNLLDSLPSISGQDWHPDMHVAAMSRVNGRLNALALLSLRPPLLVPPEFLVEANDMLLTTPQILIPWLDRADSAFTELLPWSFLDQRPSSLGSYLVHPPAAQQELMAAIKSGEISADLLVRHCIDEQALTYLIHDDLYEFTKYRELLMFATIRNRVQAMARWGFRDHGDLPSIAEDAEYTDRYGDEY